MTTSTDELPDLPPTAENMGKLHHWTMRKFKIKDRRDIGTAEADDTDGEGA